MATRMHGALLGRRGTANRQARRTRVGKSIRAALSAPDVASASFSGRVDGPAALLNRNRLRLELDFCNFLELAEAAAASRDYARKRQQLDVDLSHGSTDWLFHVPDRFRVVEVRRDATAAGKTLKELEFRTNYGASVVAISRGGDISLAKTQGLGRVALRSGDQLVLDVGSAFDATEAEFLASFHEPSVYSGAGSEESFLGAVRVTELSPLAGMTVREAGLRGLERAFLVALEQADGELEHAVSGERVLKEGDLLWFAGDLSVLDTLSTTPGLRRHKARQLQPDRLHALMLTSVLHAASPTEALGLSLNALRRATTHPERAAQLVKPLQPVHGPSAWTAAEMQSSSDWVMVFSEAEVAEIEAAVRKVIASGKALKAVTRADFPLPTLGPRLDAVLDSVVDGRGFALLRGLPVERWSREESVVAYWGLGTYWGTASPQNAKGHLIGHIKDIGGDTSDPTTRLYTTHKAQPYHTDEADLVTLLCLQPAKSGGLSSISSSHAVYNRMLQVAPHLVRVLSQPLFVDRKGEVPEGKLPFYQMPVFNYFANRLVVFFESGYYESVARLPDMPPLSAEQREALDMVAQLAADDEFRVDMQLARGDIQIIHNHQMFHTRSEYQDFEQPELRRHLLRLWLAPQQGWTLPPAIAERYGGSVEKGARGGIITPGQVATITTDAH